MPRTTAGQVAAHRVVDSQALGSIVIRAGEFRWSEDSCLASFGGVEESALLGPASEAERLPTGSLGWEHGFVLRALRLEPGATIPEHRRGEEEVIFVHSGACEIQVDGVSLVLDAGDTFTTPVGSWRAFKGRGEARCIAFFGKTSCS